MAECECLEKCPFFNDRMDNMPGMTELYKQSYCLDNYPSCARYRVFNVLGRDKVPPDLFPNDTGKADAILNKE